MGILLHIERQIIIIKQETIVMYDKIRITLQSSKEKIKEKYANILNNSVLS